MRQASRRNRPRNSRNPGRRDGWRWNANTFLCPASVDGFRRHDTIDMQGSADVTRPSQREVAILDIARHAKPKGVAKEFEVVDGPRRIIFLDGDAFLDGWEDQRDDDSEWEDVGEFDVDAAGPSRDLDSDYWLARRLQDEENAKSVPHGRRGSRDAPVVLRKAYADVLRDEAVATAG
ncbi:hypothetical protein B0H11DRAFT_1141550 [Mycena galericulata]|nr:hypothetical protein B0H11DRAFT_1141550 [Mycena galericulata]